MNRRIPEADLANAIAIMLATVKQRPEYAICSGEVSRWEAAKMSDRMKRRAARRGIRVFRHETKKAGAIDWGKFREWFKTWLETHHAQIDFARLLVSLISLLVVIL